VTNPGLTDRIIRQGKALSVPSRLWAPSNPAARSSVCWCGLLLAAYKHRLRQIVGVAPAWVSEEILSASEYWSAYGLSAVVAGSEEAHTLKGSGQ
jgi:hypothetical protein